MEKSRLSVWSCSVFLARALALLFLGAAPALANPGVTYQGRLLGPDGLPVTSSAMQFRLQIRTSLPENCLLYQETQVKDLSATRGLFSLTLNDGSAIVPNSESFTLAEVFQNRGPITFPAGKCTGDNSFTLNSLDSRQLIISFKDPSMADWEQLPTQKLNFVPTSLESVTVGGFRGSQLFRVVDGAGVPQAMDAWSVADYDRLKGIVTGTEDLIGSAAGFTGLLGGDVTGNQGSTSVIRLRGRNVADTVPTDGQALVWNQTNSRWEPGTVSGGGGGSTDWADITGKPVTFSPGAATGGDVTGNYPTLIIEPNAVTSAKIADGAVAFSKIADGSASGQVLRFNGGSWVATRLNYNDLLNNMSVSPWPGACSLGEFVTWSAVSDSFSCSGITSSIVTSALGYTPLQSSDLSGLVQSSRSLTAGTGLTGGGNLTADRSFAVDVGTGANQIPQLDGAGKLASSVIPNLSWSQITSGTPTTLAGYGITNAVTNAGDTPSIQSGLDGAKPPAGTVGRLYVSTNTQQIYRDDGSNWILVGTGTAGGGTVTNIATGTGLTGGPITGTGTISIAAGGVSSTELASNAVTTVKIADSQVTTAKIADAQVTDAKITGVAVNKIASGAGLYLTYQPDGSTCTPGQVLKWNNSRWECGADNDSATAETDPTVEAYAKQAPSAEFTTPGDVLTIANSAITTAKINDGAVTTAKIGDGQVTNAKIVGMSADKLTSGAGLYLTYQPDGSACTPGQVLKWNNSRWECGADNDSATAETDPTVEAFAKQAPNSSDFSVTGNELTLNTVPIAKGGTGATTREAAINNLLPNQGSQAGKILQTDGSNVSWMDAPATGVTSVDVSVPAYMTSTGGAITSSGTIALGFASQAQNSVFAGPASGSGAPAFRNLFIADIKANSVGNPAFWNISGACPAGQMPTYSSATDQVSCAAYAVTSGQVTTALGYTPADNSAAVLQGGNTVSATMDIGTNSNHSLGFETNGTTKMTLDPNGRLGIGTASPSRMLEVVGTTLSPLLVHRSTGETNAIRTTAIYKHRTSGTIAEGFGVDFTFAIEGNGQAEQALAHIMAVRNGNNSSGRLEFGTYSSGTLSTKMAILPGGNVGIGLTNPSERLQVDGKVRATEFCINGDCVSSWPSGGGGGSLTGITGTANQIGVDNTDPAVPVISLADLAVSPAGSYGSTTQVPAITVDAKGRVTSVANTAIDLSPAGKTLATNQVWVGSGSNQAAARFFGAGDLRNSSGTAQIPASCAASQTLTWSAITDVFNCTNISITTSQVSNFPSLGTAAAKNFGTVAGNLVELDGTGKIPTGLLPASTGFQNGGNSFGAAASLGTNDAYNLSLRTNNTDRMIVSSTGNIGMGPATPLFKLHVESSGSTAALFKTTSASGGIGVSASGTIMVPEVKASGDNLVLEAGFNDRLTILGANGNVGIGTTSPGARLDIQTAGSAANESSLVLRNPSTNALSTTSMDFYTAGAWRGSLWTMRNSGGNGAELGLTLADTAGVGQQRLRILANGNMGVGTTAPTERLDVAGNARITGRMVANASTDADALSSISVDFTNSNTIRVTGASAACGTLNFTNVASGGYFTVTIPNATATCSTIQMNGSTANVKLPTGYAGGIGAAGVVYTAIFDGTTLWVSFIPF